MIRFTIPDMDCEGCVASITQAVHKADPAAHVAADLTRKLVDITSTLPVGALSSLIDAAGFTVQVG